MKNTMLSLAAVAAFGLAACGGQDEQHTFPQGPATETSPGATTPATTTPGTTAPGTAQPGVVPDGPGTVGAGTDHGAPRPMQHDTIGYQQGTGTAPGATGTGRP